MVMRSIRRAEVRDALHRSLKAELPEIEALGALPGVQVFLFAGAVRDALLAADDWKGGHVSSRDFDIGVQGISREVLCEWGKDYNAIPNRWGGIRVRTSCGEKSADIWCLDQTVGLIKRNVPYSVHNVLRSFILSCNAVAFDLNSGELLDAGAEKSISRRRIDIVDDPIWHDRAVFAAKALALRERFAFELSPQCARLTQTFFTARALKYEYAKAALRSSIDEGAAVCPRTYPSTSLRTSPFVIHTGSLRRITLTTRQQCGSGRTSSPLR
jgi:hypothetical protein